LRRYLHQYQYRALCLFGSLEAVHSLVLLLFSHPNMHTVDGFRQAFSKLSDLLSLVWFLSRYFYKRRSNTFVSSILALLMSIHERSLPRSHVVPPLVRDAFFPFAPRIELLMIASPLSSSHFHHRRHKTPAIHWPWWEWQLPFSVL
jgi:hypothetical protein